MQLIRAASVKRDRDDAWRVKVANWGMTLTAILILAVTLWMILWTKGNLVFFDFLILAGAVLGGLLLLDGLREPPRH
jgi:uncharacterized RDD family membrane protein YckC